MVSGTRLGEDGAEAGTCAAQTPAASIGTNARRRRRHSLARGGGRVIWIAAREAAGHPTWTACPKHVTEDSAFAPARSDTVWQLAGWYRWRVQPDIPASGKQPAWDV